MAFWRRVNWKITKPFSSGRTSYRFFFCFKTKLKPPGSWLDIQPASQLHSFIRLCILISLKNIINFFFFGRSGTSLSLIGYCGSHGATCKGHVKDGHLTCGTLAPRYDPHGSWLPSPFSRQFHYFFFFLRDFRAWMSPVHTLTGSATDPGFDCFDNLFKLRPTEAVFKK